LHPFLFYNRPLLAVTLSIAHLWDGGCSG
jgi:hypothetical protein